MDTSGTVFIFGAGASHGARTDRSPPLGIGLAQYLLNWLMANTPDETDPELSVDNPTDPRTPSDYFWQRRRPDEDPLIDQLRPVLQRAAGATGFESAMAELMDDENSGFGLLTEMNRLVAVALLGGRDCRFDFRRDYYDDLFEQLGPDLRAIVTPNYDVLAEGALARRDRLFRYCGTNDPLNPGEVSAVRVYKFHGSANWFLGSGAGGGSTLATAKAHLRPLRAVPQYGVAGFSNDRFYVVREQTNAFLEYKAEPYAAAVLATYGRYKPAVYGRDHLNAVRDECLSYLRRCPPRRIIAIGIAPPVEPDDDATWHELCVLARSLPSVREYWSRDSAERARMADYGFDGRVGWFAELVDSMRR